MSHIDPVPRSRSQEEVFRATCRWERSYGIYLTDDVFAPHGMLASRLDQRRTLVVTTPTVWSIYGPHFARLRDALDADVAVLVLEVTEQEKSIENALRICQACQEHDLGRTDSILALGGGVCSDLVTVAATLVRRGLPYICVPTTLVGQIDAGVGIKGAVNFQGAKSYLGSFRPPEAVLIDPAFLSTAPATTQLDGIAESIKIALIADAYLFRLLEESGASIGSGPEHDASRTKTLLRHAITRILEELSANFFEDQTYRRKVDFGHTFSGLLEDRSNYQLSHGHAVSIDMALSASISTTLGILPPDDAERILAVLRACSLPIWSPLLTPELGTAALHSASLHRGGEPNLVIPHAVGECDFITDARIISRQVLETSIARLTAR